MAQQRATMSATDHAAPSLLSILLVDDNDMVREVTAGMLADAGHQVRTAPDGLAALSDLQEHGLVDLVITDISMPQMDGLALVDQIRIRWPGVRVLLVSGRAQPPGTEAFMLKPFRWSDLAQALSDVQSKPDL